MKRIFLDTFYLQAPADSRDSNHQRAKEATARLNPFISITSEMVLTELLNALSSRGEYLRRTAIEIVKELRNNRRIKIIPQTSEQFGKAFVFYEQRLDKGYSLTDCASMIIMQEQKISEVLTFDKHFQQEGFVALLREDY
ncbi:MAG: type II toxin-antitoxin system VapC family toxin [Microcystaceae cyanobacterium]